MGRRKYWIILVEDSEDDLILFEVNLRRTGLHQTFDLACHFTQGEAAIYYFQNLPRSLVREPYPDIVFLDIKLPGCSGFDVLTRMPPLNPRPVIVVHTSSILPEDKQKAEQLGADLFQTKLVDPGEFSRFLQSVARLVDRRRTSDSGRGQDSM